MGFDDLVLIYILEQVFFMFLVLVINLKSGRG